MLRCFNTVHSVLDPCSCLSFLSPAVFSPPAVWHWPSGSILSSEICLAPDGSTHNRSNGPAPSVTHAHTANYQFTDSYFTLSTQNSTLCSLCTYRAVCVLMSGAWPSDKVARLCQWFPRSSQVMSSCWNPAGTGSRTVCHQGNLEKEGRAMTDCHPQ